MDDSPIRISDPCDELMAALAAAQGELTNPVKDKDAKVKGQTREGKSFDYAYKYTDIAAVLEDVRPVTSKHGIAVVQIPTMQGGAMVLVTRLAKGTQWIESDYPVCRLDQKHQDMGGALTYAKRYSLMAMLGIAAAGEDTDGENAAKASAPDKPPPREPQPLRDSLKGTAPADARKSASAAKRDGDWDLLTREMAEQRTSDELREWSKGRAKMIKALPSQWFTELQELFEKRLADLSAEPAFQEEMSPEAQAQADAMDEQFRNTV